MAKIQRALMKIFGSNAGPNQIEQFGSLAAGSPVYTTDPEEIQNLANYLTGWFAGVVGSNSPAIEDMNALCYLFAYQLSYLFQSGVAEWNDETTYYIGSIVQANNFLYLSLTDDNLNNAVTDLTKWKKITSAINDVGLKTGNYNIALGDDGGEIRVNSAAGAFNLQLPSGAASGFNFRVKDVTGNCGTNAVTLVRVAAENIENLAADYALNADYGSWTVWFDGTNWWII